MSYQETIKYPGQGRVATLSGTIALEQSTGRLIIRDPITGQPRNVQDINGMHVFTSAGEEMTRVDQLGVSTIEPTTQRHRNRLGITTQDGRTGVWTSEPGEDVRQLLGESIDT